MESSVKKFQEIFNLPVTGIVDKATWYKKPENIVGVPVNPITGELNTNKNTILYYIKGTEPTTNNELDEFIPTLKEETN